MMDFKEYREKAYEYMKNKCIIENNIKILEEQGVFVKQWGESSGRLTIRQGMTTKEMKAIEDEYNVCFALGGSKFVDFDFNEKDNNTNNKLLKEIRDAQKNTSDLYNNYFKEVLQSVYQSTEICGKRHKVELGRRFWGFTIQDIDKLTLDEIIEIEKETDSIFVNYDVTNGYHFNFNK